MSARQRAGITALNGADVRDQEIAYEIGVSANMIYQVRRGASILSPEKEDALLMLCLDHDQYIMATFDMPQNYVVVRVDMSTVNGCLSDELQPAIEGLGQGSAAFAAGDPVMALGFLQKAREAITAAVAESTAFLHRQKEQYLNEAHA